MAEKTERIEARVDPTQAERIRLASGLLHTSVSGFIVRAATQRAEEVLAEFGSTTVPDDYFQRLLASLDEPPKVVPALARASDEVRLNPAFKQN